MRWQWRCFDFPTPRLELYRGGAFAMSGMDDTGRRTVAMTLRRLRQAVLGVLRGVA